MSTLPYYLWTPRISFSSTGHAKISTRLSIGSQVKSAAGRGDQCQMRLPRSLQAVYNPDEGKDLVTLVIMSSVCGDAFLPTMIVVLHSTPIACSPHAS